MLPVETRLALFPDRSRRVRMGLWRRPVVLHPVTLARAAVMEAMGCGMLGGSLETRQAIVAAWILSLDDRGVERAGRGDIRGAVKFVRRLKGRVAGVARIVNEMVAEALLPFIPAKSEEDKGWRIDDGLPEGCGWPLEVAEALCAHYRMGFDDAMRTEVSRAFALMAVARYRIGGEHGGPDYYERIRIERLREAGIIGGRKDGPAEGK